VNPVVIIEEPWLPPSLGDAVFVLLTGVGLVALLLAARFGARLLPLGAARREAIARVQPAVGALLVVAWALAVVGRVFGDHPDAAPFALGGAILAAVILSWSALRDVAAGVVLRAQAFCAVGDHVRVGDVAGVVREIGVRALRVETHDGEEALIPYHRVQSEPFIKAPRLSGSLRHHFVVDIPTGWSVARAREAARVAALNAHWSSVARDPEVDVVGDGTMEVHVFPIDPAHGHEVEADVRSALLKRAAGSRDSGRLPQGS
jgi:small-conductance mechanosensitive channel